MHRLDREQVIAAPLERVWPFFATPANLDVLTPPELRFRILAGVEPGIRVGQIIRYRIRVAPLCWVSWVTEITAVEPGRTFVDEQRFGPYRFWHHRHDFEDLGDRVRMRDTVHYLVGWSVLGSALHALWIRRRLEQIFAYRAAAVERLLRAPAAAEATARQPA